jgi:antitoxin (DNA-binding transcriptional repressor) of toxin-antitoxin stability system
MMKPVKIAELKDRLSYYLRRVQRGESILVADRDKVIARIERVTGREAVPAGDAEWVERLERQGIIHRGSGHVDRKWLKEKPVVKADVVAILVRDRDEGP